VRAVVEGTDATVFLDKDYAEFAKKQNAIVQATLHGISMEGAALYCILCAKMKINARIRKLFIRRAIRIIRCWIFAAGQN
jgi:deoxycytidylate deaminase